MNKLDRKARTQILGMMVEGMSMQSITRLTGASKNTVAKLLAMAGEACIAYHHEHVRSVEAQRVQCDEIWSFCAMKEKNVPKENRASRCQLRARFHQGPVATPRQSRATDY